jgi:hypothetical protein
MAASVAGRGRAACCALLVALLGTGGCGGTSTLSGLPPAAPGRTELVATPFFPQTEHQCGPAALATVLGAAGVEASPAALAAEVYLPGRKGSLQAELAAAIRARGLLAYPVGPATSDLFGQVAAGWPVLVLQKLGFGPWPAWHYAVVIGYDQAAATVVLRSGTSGWRCVPRSSMPPGRGPVAGRWSPFDRA